MNDLERDLHELFDERSRDVDPAVLAPDAIIRRGHRRQARTAVGGVLAGVVVIAIAVAAVGSIERSDGVTPAGTNDLPARATHIGGVPVTAPAGWTLIDDTPLLNVISTSTQSCSFSASGTAVSENGSPVAGSGPAPEPSSDCTSAPADLPAGVPFLQLANFELPLMESVCDWGEGSVASLPADGVAVYVAAFPSGAATSTLLDACPGAEQYAGENASTFGLTSSDDSVQLTMAAVAVAGPDASDTDLEAVRSFFDQPIFGQTNPYVALDPARVGPGYVLAAGGTAQEGWRLEAGIKSFAADGKPMPASIFVTTASGAEIAKADATLFNSEDLAIVGGQVVQHGNLAGGFTGVDVAGSDGVVTHADVYAWPQNLLTIADSQAFDNAGGIWLATPPQEGDVTFVQGGAAQPTSPPDARATGQHLQTRETDAGLVVYGHDLGHDWEIHLDNGVTRFFVDGVEDPGGSFSFAPGASIAVDVEGGTFLIGIYPRSVTTWTVTVDGSDPRRLIAGRSTPAQANDGQPANLWLVALPGSGTGLSRGLASLPTFDSWPTPLYPDGLFGAGSDAVVSWGITHHTDQCALVKVIGADPSDSGTSVCLPSWYELDRNGGTPLIGGVYGRENATVTIVVPGETPVTASGRTPDCFTVRVESNFANTEFCVFSLPVGETTTVAFGDSGTAFDGPIDITALPGRLNLGSASATPSP